MSHTICLSVNTLSLGKKRNGHISSQAINHLFTKCRRFLTVYFNHIVWLISYFIDINPNYLIKCLDYNNSYKTTSIPIFCGLSPQLS